MKEIEKKLTSTLRSEDILVKLENNKFSILLNDIGKAKFASAVANKIIQAVSEPVKAENTTIQLMTHIGICVYPTEGTSLEDLLKNTDIALSKAKNAGADTFKFYTQTMDAEASEYIHMEKSLRKALANNEFTLYYQPKVHLKSGEVARIEALIRWVHPDIGVVSPEKFLPIAEETGLIHPIGEWALREACKMNKHWQNEGYSHMPIAVNLSSKQFYHPDIAKVISNVLKETELNPNYLELEITETAMMDEVQKATTILADIKTTGVQISIDHFGVGYFSISQLKQFPLTLLKIDQSFIKGIPNNPNDSAITTAIIALAHHLGLEVVAEGVETAEQVQFLSSQNCDMVQGYFLSQPLPADQIVLQFKKLAEGVLL
jgi:EAL domain-containing protein (putative c-di-GMP-specific phosphodiesterase class I)